MLLHWRHHLLRIPSGVTETRAQPLCHALAPNRSRVVTVVCGGVLPCRHEETVDIMLCTYIASATRVFAFDRPDVLTERDMRSGFMHHSWSKRGCGLRMQRPCLLQRQHPAGRLRPSGISHWAR